VGRVGLLPLERRNDYLVRLAGNEPGLSHLLVRELRELGKGKRKEMPAIGERVIYATLFAESKTMKDQMEREQREQERQAHQRHLQDVHARQYEPLASSRSGSGAQFGGGLRRSCWNID
jgi:hypothetical protein